MPALGFEAQIVDELRLLGLSAELRKLELPDVQVVGPWKTRRPTRKAMLGGHFYVYGQAEELRLPIDWRQDPHGSRTWRYELHTLTWLKEALVRHAKGGDIETLVVARDIVLGWTREHLRSEKKQSEFAWYDMAVGLRAPYLAYVLCACLAEGILGDEDAELLVDAADRHGTSLASGENYAAGNNHGLFQDEGLYLLARLLPALPRAPAWRELAVTRMKATLQATVSVEDGAHLEHSPAYQLAVLDLVARLVANVTELPELGGLLDRMRRTAAWQVTPEGHMVQIGDTDDLPAPQWAGDTTSSLRGINALFNAGQAFVRESDSYLAVSAAYHGPAHKHADDTGFLLAEGGRVLFGDAGRWGYYEREPDRLYARSATAHNVLTVDGRDFDWRQAEPYGSGLDSAGEGNGWYVIAMRNPLLAKQKVDYRRILIYRPGQMLIVIDEVRSVEEREYARHFHFGAELEAKKDKEGRIAISGEGITATFTDFTTEKTTAELACGRDDPRLGWAYPGDRERTAVWTATLRSRAKEATLVAALALGEEAPAITGAMVESEQVEIEFDGAPNLHASLTGRYAILATGRRP